MSEYVKCRCGKPMWRTSKLCNECAERERRGRRERWCPNCRTKWAYPRPGDYSEVGLDPATSRRVYSSIEEFIEIAREYADYSEDAFQILRDWYWWIQPARADVA